VRKGAGSLAAPASGVAMLRGDCAIWVTHPITMS
jgi:hypothetical protein